MHGHSCTHGCSSGGETCFLWAWLPASGNCLQDLQDLVSDPCYEQDEDQLCITQPPAGGTPPALHGHVPTLQLSTLSCDFSVVQTGSSDATQPSLPPPAARVQRGLAEGLGARSHWRILTGLAGPTLHHHRTWELPRSFSPWSAAVRESPQ